MPKVEFEGAVLSPAPEQSLLEALLEAGYSIPNSCRAGACQSCLMQATEGEVPAEAQAGLKDTHQAQGYFLACRCRPQGDLKVRLPAPGSMRVSARVTDKALLAPDVLRLRLRAQGALDYRAGQYVTVWRDEALGRSYSLASVPGLDEELELHVRRVPEGAMSNWMHDELEPGVELALQGPAGDCFYLEGGGDRPLLLAGTSTGLAPLIGIARDALDKGHRGSIHLFHGALVLDGLYLRDELQALEAAHDNFHYHPSVMHAEETLPVGVEQGAIDAKALAVADSLGGWKVYLCGAPDLVRRMRKQAFLAGADMGDIYADAFVSGADTPEAA